MRVQVTENWFRGAKVDERSAALASGRQPGVLKVGTKEGRRYASFTRWVAGQEVEALQPLWQPEVVRLDDMWIVLTGVQRQCRGGPLFYQEWTCLILDVQRKP